jgi:hypothetical protein
MTWSSPMTNRLLFEAGLGTTYYGWGNFERDPNPTRNLIRVTENCARGCADNGGVSGLVYRSQDFADNYTGAYAWRASGSYVTGAHSVKIGYQGVYLTDDRKWMTNDQNLSYRVQNGVPDQLTQLISPWINKARAGWTALYAQEQWTMGRLTLQGALRYDRAGSSFPEQQLGPSRFLPTPIVFPAQKGVDSYNDITPRIGVAWDVFGNGRTALKANLGKYLEGVGTAANYVAGNPTSRLPITVGGAFATGGVTRTWTDTNRNFVPDCDLLNPQANTGADFCGQMSNVRFGQNVATNTIDPALLKGWGVRPSDWSLNVSVQQQILPRASIEVAYARRSFSGFNAIDNRLVGASDYATFSITAPSDSRLPGGGGQIISGLYDVNPDRSGQIDNLVADSRQYGDWYQYFNGLDVTINVRARDGLTFQGGTSTGQNVADNCEVRANLPELGTGGLGTALGPGLAGSTVGPTNPYCHVAYGVLTQFRGLATYTIPKIDVQVSGVMQSKPGPLLAANYSVPNLAVVPSLKRNLSGNATQVVVNLIEPGTLYGNRLNQLDLKVAKRLRFGARRAMIGVDLFNALNSGAILTYNNTFNAIWLQPLTILTPRMAKITAEFTF